MSGDFVQACCPICDTFTIVSAKTLIECTCGQLFVAIAATDFNFQGVRNVNSCAFNQFSNQERDSLLVASNGSIHSIKSKPSHFHGDGSCGQCECHYGSPLVVTNRFPLPVWNNDFDMVNIFPVKKVELISCHGTRSESVVGIYKHGLLPKTDTRINPWSGHGNSNTEGWLRFTGSMRAAKAHDKGAIVPIKYNGYVLESCMGLDPGYLLKLFEIIPCEIQCIKMDEDKESYVFRESAELFPLDMTVADLMRHGLGRDKLADLLGRIAFDNTDQNRGEVVDVPVTNVLSHVWAESRYEEALNLLSIGEDPEPIDVTEIEFFGQIFYAVGDGNHRAESFRDTGREYIKARILRRTKCNLADIEILDRDDGIFLYRISEKFGFKMNSDDPDLEFYRKLAIPTIKQDLRTWWQRLLGIPYRLKNHRHS